MRNFLSKEWCNRVFRLSYPLLKKVDIAIPISEQLHFDNPNYNRYYKKPMIYQNGEIYILCSQWFEYQRECLESWINRPDATEKIKTTVVSNPDDFRFSKDAHIEKSNPLLKGLNERMGTPSHIEYLKMSEDDSRRHKSRCKEYDKKKDVCMCVQSPYFTIRCGGSSHCKYYSEYIRKESNIYIQEEKRIHSKKAVEVISVATQKRRKCIHCQGKTERYMMGVEYSDNGKIVSNKLPIYECSQCGAAFLVETIFKSYTTKKDADNISVEFKMSNV